MERCKAETAVDSGLWDVSDSILVVHLSLRLRDLHPWLEKTQPLVDQDHCYGGRTGKLFRQSFKVIPVPLKSSGK